MRPSYSFPQSKTHATSHDLQIFDFNSILARKRTNKIEAQGCDLAFQPIYF